MNAQKLDTELAGYDLSPFVTSDVFGVCACKFSIQGAAVNALERYWLSSSRIAVFVDRTVPLLGKHRSGMLVLKARVEGTVFENSVSCRAHSEFQQQQEASPLLTYSIFVARHPSEMSLWKFHKAVAAVLFEVERMTLSLPAETDRNPRRAARSTADLVDVE